MFSLSKRLPFTFGFGLTFFLMVAVSIAFLAGDAKAGTTVLLIGIGCGMGWGVDCLFTRGSIVKPLVQLPSPVEPEAMSKIRVDV